MPSEKDTHGALTGVLSLATRYKSVIILMTVIVPIVALGVSLQQQKVYRATAEVLLDRQDLGAALTGIPSADANADPERYARTQAAIASVPAVARRAIKISGVKGVTTDDLLADSTVSPRVDSDLLQFIVDNTDATDAIRLATAYAVAFGSYKFEKETASLRAARKELEARLADLRAQGAVGTQMYADVFKQVQDVRTLELLQARASVARNATTAEQVQPRPVRSAALGAVLGLLLGFGIAALWNTLDKRIRTEAEVEEGLGLPLLARLPRYTKKVRGRDSLVMLEDPSHHAAEAIRLLRANIELASMGQDAKTIMVTSAMPKEGKSTTIANLGVALARAGHRVALVDLDLRQPVLSKAFDLVGRPGVTDVLMERASLDDALSPVELTSSSRPRQASVANSSAGALRVLPAGPIPPDPGEFVGAQRLAVLMSTLRQQYDFVLIDAPPVLAVGDAVSLSTISDALFVVVRLDVLNRPMLRDLSRVLRSCPCAKLGFALTNAGTREMYGTQYGHAVKEATEEPTPLRGIAASPR